MRDELARQARVVRVGIRRVLENALRDGQVAHVQALVDEFTGSDRIVFVRVLDTDGHLTHQPPGLRSRPATGGDALAVALRERITQEASTQSDRGPVIACIVPLEGTSGGLLGALEIVQLESFSRSDPAASRRAVFGLSAGSVPSAGILASMATRARISRPVGGLLLHVRRGRRATSPRAGGVGRDADEARLAAEVSRMRRELEDAQKSHAIEYERRHRAEMRLAGSEKLASLGSLAAGIAHEIGTPLNVISGYAESLLGRVGGRVTDYRGLQARLDPGHVFR